MKKIIIIISLFAAINLQAQTQNTQKDTSKYILTYLEEGKEYEAGFQDFEEVLDFIEILELKLENILSIKDVSDIEVIEIKQVNKTSTEISFNDLPELKPTLTLQKVKDMITFPKESGLYKSLTGLCDVWFLTEKQKGATDEAALKVTVEKLGDKVLSLFSLE